MVYFQSKNIPKAGKKIFGQGHIKQILWDAILMDLTIVNYSIPTDNIKITERNLKEGISCFLLPFVWEY